MNKLNLSQYQNQLSLRHKLGRILWQLVWFCFARPLPKGFGRSWKNALLRIFGAKIHKHAHIYSSAKIYAPWNLEMDAYACLAPKVDCYNVAKIKIGAHATVSQKTFLCSASHDIEKSDFPLITAPIVIENQSWVGAASFIGMGVTIGEGAVIGATSSVFKDVKPWTVVGGNPATFIKNRVIK